MRYSTEARHGILRRIENPLDFAHRSRPFKQGVTEHSSMETEYALRRIQQYVDVSVAHGRRVP